MPTAYDSFIGLQAGILGCGGKTLPLGRQNCFLLGARNVQWWAMRMVYVHPNSAIGLNRAYYGD